jgi:hypothetical protein
LGLGPDHRAGARQFESIGIEREIVELETHERPSAAR